MARWRAETISGNYAAARLVGRVGVLLALLEVCYSLMMLMGTNTSDLIFRFVRSLAEPLALFFPGLFDLANDDLTLIVNYGLAALFWVVVSGFAARILV